MTAVNQRLHLLLDSHAASLWTHLLSSELGVEDVDPPEFVPTTKFSCKAKQRFSDWKTKFRDFSNEEIKFMVTWWQRMEGWLSMHAPSILLSLNPPAKEEDFHLFHSRLHYPFPRLLRLLYSFHNGQMINIRNQRMDPNCLFGGYNVYNEAVYNHFLSINDIASVTLNVTNQHDLQESTITSLLSTQRSDRFLKPVEDMAIFIASFASPKFICCNNENIFTHFDRLDVLIPCVEDSARVQSMSPLLQWLQEYLTRLETGVYRYEPIDLTDPFAVRDSDPRRISLFAYSDNTSISHGIEVSPSPLFIPSLSSSVGELFFAYNIRMTAVPDRMPSASLQLARRHWRIRAGATEEVVDGEGVIGLYPRFHRDQPSTHPFSYESCTHISPPGAMSGTFTFVVGSLSAPQGEVQVAVPSFELAVPAFIF